MLGLMKSGKLWENVMIGQKEYEVSVVNWGKQ